MNLSPVQQGWTALRHKTSSTPSFSCRSNNLSVHDGKNQFNIIYQVIVLSEIRLGAYYLGLDSRLWTVAWNWTLIRVRQGEVDSRLPGSGLNLANAILIPSMTIRLVALPYYSFCTKL